ncbi:hypothetical protein [Enterovibrio norvegicus]|uniref:hypothetical protein n=1 Tax=Enterovibrio norvegicus TaxID=188144 RepID=UPI0010BE69FE|nr:hypothetical protein [Enterovibrio norvegicus]TKF36963.1 hypothetical protein FCV83_01990 [Enterovibrio norvegicus]
MSQVVGEMNRETPVLMIKFMPSQYLADFLKDGRLHMNKLSYFKELEETNVVARSDNHEGAEVAYFFDSFEFSLGEELITAQSAKLRIHHEYNLCMNVYCMTAITVGDLIESGGEIRLSADFLEFGDKAVVFYNEGLRLFVDRLSETLNTIPKIASHQKYKHFAKKIEYMPATYSGEFGIFRKQSQYSWQYEWRLAVEQKETSGLYDRICLGDISQWAHVFDTKELLNEPIRISN